MAELVATVKAKCTLLALMASPKLRLRVLQSGVQTLIAYSLPTGAYTSQDISRLDSLVACCAKRAMHLPGWAPNAMVHEDRDKAGMGITSMLTDYVQGSAAILTRALNDQGKLGAVTRALLPRQLQLAGHRLTLETANKLRYCRLARIATLIKRSGLTLVHSYGTDTQTALGEEKNALAELLASAPASELGIHTHLPEATLLPLWELGITHLGQVLDRKGTRVVRASCLAATLQQHGLALPHNRIARRHKLALNRLTLLLNATPVAQPAPHTHNSDADLPIERRAVKASSLFCDTSTHTYPTGAAYKNGQTTLDAHVIKASAPTGTPAPLQTSNSTGTPSV